MCKFVLKPKEITTKFFVTPSKKKRSLKKKENALKKKKFTRKGKKSATKKFAIKESIVLKRNKVNVSKKSKVLLEVINLLIMFIHFLRQCLL